MTRRRETARVISIAELRGHAQELRVWRKGEWKCLASALHATTRSTRRRDSDR